MRYTRYNYKKKSKNNILKSILSFSLMSVFVIIVGVLLANVIIYFLPINDAGNKMPPTNTVEDKGTNDGDDVAIVDGVPDETSNEVNATANNAQGTEQQATINTEFVAIQCGYFANNDKANEALGKISSSYGGFIFNDADKFKVIAGVYTAEQGQTIIDSLNTSGIENYKVSFSLNGSDKIQQQIAAICNGYLDILSATFNDKVESFNTEDFKGWVTKLDNISEGEGIEVLNEIKNHINEIPVKISKENVANEMQYVYKQLLNFQN